jgi:hypothetical protein
MMSQDSYRQENEKGLNVSHSGDGHIYINHGISVDKSEPEESRQLQEESAEGTESGCGPAAFILLALVALVIIALTARCGTEPEPGKPWPSGISRGMILQPIAEKIANCSKEAVLEPRGCPQSSSASEASEVHWTVHGDPVDGAEIKFDGRSFSVYGVAVMTVRYRRSSADFYKLHITPYRASVFQDSGRLGVGSIVRKGEASPNIQKRQATAKWADVKTAVRERFNQCLASKLEPMPPGCPKGAADGDTGDPLRNLESDPLLNATSEFDKLTGITHIRGSYSIHIDTENFFGARVQVTQSGDYDAAVIISSIGIEVLDIHHEN